MAGENGNFQSSIEIGHEFSLSVTGGKAPSFGMGDEVISTFAFAKANSGPRLPYWVTLSMMIQESTTEWDV